MSISKGSEGLYFPCDCVSGRQENYSEPWAAVAKNKLLPNGTKEEILNLVAQEPRTISQLARELKIAPPTVHVHINDLLASELLRDSEEWEKLHPKERYYEPNFPVITEQDRAEFEEICQKISEKFAEIFEQARPQFEEAFTQSDLEERGWNFADVTQYLYTCIQRRARKLLEERGSLPQAEKHRNGTEWIFWAEKPKTKK